MRILGIDYGEKRIGLAISDESCTIATPVSTIKYSSVDYAIKELERFIKDYEIGEIIVGLPLNLKGEFSAQTKKVINFIELLKSKLKLPVKTYDERFTSVAAERELIEADMSRKKRKKLIDKLTAQIILKDYLESLCIKQSH